MKKSLLLLATLFLVLACSSPEKKGIKIYGWSGAPNNNYSEESLSKQMKEFKKNHIKGLFYGTGFNVENATKAAKAAKAEGLEFHAWIPTMKELISKTDSSYFAVSREGYSTLTRPPFVDYYTFLCPNNEAVFQHLKDKYLEIAAIPEVDGIHLDYVRFPDVILAEGLWEKYGLTMDQEYAPYDYCYCDKCVGDFKEQSGIDIRELGDSAQYNTAWRQFRCDLITTFVNRMADEVHKAGKKITAAVFPGPSMAINMVRQEWDKWNLDAVLPMNYNDFYLKGPEWLEEINREGAELLKGRMPIYSGLFICGTPDKKSQIEDPEGHGLVPSEMREAVEGSIRGGAEAICVFVPNNMTPAHWEAIDDLIEK